MCFALKSKQPLLGERGARRARVSVSRGGAGRLNLQTNDYRQLRGR